MTPLRIRYDVEPSFKWSFDGLFRDDEVCGSFTDARWRPGVVFVLTHERGPCSKTRFRAMHIYSDGRLELRTRIQTTQPKR